MKKSQLKTLIRESVKELMTEQLSTINVKELFNSYHDFAQIDYTSSGPGSVFDIQGCNMQTNTKGFIIGILGTQGPAGNYIFNSVTNNPSQPCQYLQNRITAMQGNINNSPNNPAVPQWECKIEIFTAILAWVQSHPNLQSVSPPWTC